MLFGACLPHIPSLGKWRCLSTSASSADIYNKITIPIFSTSIMLYQAPFNCSSTQCCRLFCCIITTPEFLAPVLMLHVFYSPLFFTARAITGVVIASIVGVGRKLFKKITNMGRQRTEGMLEFIGSDVIIDDVIFYQLLNYLSVTNSMTTPGWKSRVRWKVST